MCQLSAAVFQLRQLVRVVSGRVAWRRCQPAPRASVVRFDQLQMTAPWSRARRAGPGFLHWFFGFSHFSGVG